MRFDSRTRTAAGSLLLLALGLGACASEERASEEPATEADDLIGNPPGKPATAPYLSADYASLSAIEKQRALWEMVSSEEYCKGGRADAPFDYAASDGCLDALPTGGLGYMFKAAKSLVSLNTTFDRESDEAPKGRYKLFHPFGSIATAEFKASYPDVPESGVRSSRKAPYTGLFANTGGAAPIMLRLAPGGGSSFIPGVSVKFLLDGRPSQNLHAIESFDGQGKDWNYFHSVPTNVLPQPKNPVVRAATNLLKAVKKEPNRLSVEHVAGVTADGEVAGEVRAPYQIEFRPHGDIGERFGDDDHVDFRAVLRRIPPRTVVYDVYARATKEDADLEKIGEIKTTSYLVASQRGDAQIFFQHNRGE